MKYCIDVGQKTKSSLLKSADELTIHFRPSDKTLVTFLQEHQEQRINIAIDDNDDFIEGNRIKVFETIVEKYPDINFVLRLSDFKKESTRIIYEDIIKSKYKIKYFFDTFIKDWDTLIGYLNLKPTDVYITEALGFEIISCAEAAHERGVQIRVFPNIAQSSWKTSAAITKFFIRPEDVQYYEPYVDVMEFFGKPEQLHVYHKIYSKDRKWFGNLSEIIIGLNEDIDSRCFLPTFGLRRLNCGKKCLKGNKCLICAATQHLADTLVKNDLTIKQLSQKQSRAIALKNSGQE